MYQTLGDGITFSNTSDFNFNYYKLLEGASQSAIANLEAFILESYKIKRLQCSTNRDIQRHFKRASRSY